jgi:deoxyribodipyrimidine photo-lyase
MRKFKGTAIHWFRRDLRLCDNPALLAACEFESVVPLFIWDFDSSWENPLGAASKWWIHNSLQALDAQLKSQGSRLIIKTGDPATVLTQLILETKAEALFFNRLYDPKTRAYDKKLTENLKHKVKRLENFDCYLLMDPGKILKKDRRPYIIYTAFFNAIMRNFKNRQICPKAKLPLISAIALRSASLEELKLDPKKMWAKGLKKRWKPGELQAQEIMQEFIDKNVVSYLEQRNIPAQMGTSSLSPYLHFGEISPATVVNYLEDKSGSHYPSPSGYQFLKELFWRDFSHYLLFHYPKLESESLRKDFSNFPWHQNDKLEKSWQKGLTGYPIVDAGMRQLWSSGWMHNRVRMIAASFLVKDLLLSWQQGAKWFWDTLVDANLANNTQGWQWTAGCGADAAPYFRIFNPTLQGKKFDPDGVYIKTWCPELANLPNKWIHEPWMASPEVLKESGVIMGKNYPYPVIDHGIARSRALSAYFSLKNK